MKYVYVRLITALALMVCVMLALLTLQEHVIYYQEQHTLLLWTSAWWRHALATGGIAYWLGAFVVQFYHIPWLGAMITALILTAVYLLTESLIRRLTGRRDLLQLGVAAAVGLYFTLDGIDETPGIAAAAMLSLLLAWALTFIPGLPLPRRRPDAPLSWPRVALAALLAAAYICTGFWLEMRHYDRSERAMVLADKAVSEQRWDDALRYTDSYLANVKPNRLMLYLRFIALAHKGQLLDRLFEYPNPYGTDAVTFPWKSESRPAEYGHLAHELTGNLNDAHHWAFEAMTVWGETAPILRRLALYNMAMGRPEVARKFAGRLAESLFYRAEGRRMLADIDAGSRGPLHYAFAQADTTALQLKWVNVLSGGPGLYQVVKSDPSNDLAREYLYAWLLTRNDINTLMSVLSEQAADPRATPRARELARSPRIEEAKLIFTLYPKNPSLESLGLTFDEPVTGPRYGRFSTFNHPNSEERLRQEMGDTFWYYITRVCRYGQPSASTPVTATPAEVVPLRH